MGFSLNGTRILITREKKQAQKLVDIVNQHNGEPVVAPLLSISCKHEAGHRAILQQLNKYQWILFTSANGVHAFFQILQENNMQKKALFSNKLAVVGHKTAAVLKEYGYIADFIPTTYNAEVMAEEFLAGYTSVARILLVRGNRSRPTLPEQLTKHHVPYDTIEVYETLINYSIRDWLNQLIRERGFDVITFTSPSTVQAFMEMTKDTEEILNHIPVACIGTTTEKKAKEAGFTNTIIPDVFTIDRMIEKISDYILNECSKGG